LSLSSGKAELVIATGGKIAHPRKGLIPVFGRLPNEMWRRDRGGEVENDPERSKILR